MKKYLIKGEVPLSGRVCTSGAKNAALPILAATLLTKEEVRLGSIPKLRDISVMVELLRKLGKEISYKGRDLVVAQREEQPDLVATYELVKQMRASIAVLGPLLSKYGQATVSLPGGCVFGPRPIDLHLKGLRALGAEIKIHHGNVEATTPNRRSREGRGGPPYLRGNEIDLRGVYGPSVLGTDNVLMAAVLAKGKTVIHNAAREPETEDLIHFLNRLGAKIKGGGSSTLEIEGVRELGGGRYTVIQDRIEAGTFLVLGALSEGEVEIEYNHPEHLKAVFELAEEIGIGLEFKPGQFKVKRGKLRHYQSFHLATLPYPDFPTDLQPLFMTLATRLSGNSTIHDKVYPNRYTHALELNRMGANIKIAQEVGKISGVERLEGAKVQASDIRAGAALIAAGLAAEGKTEVHRIYHCERGYEELPKKLRQLGAQLQVLEDELG